MNNSEAQIRQQALQSALKVEALDWLKARAPKDEHPIGCPSQDDTGWPVPCNCGYRDARRVTEFIRQAIIKA